MYIGGRKGSSDENKSIWVLILTMLVGIVLGGFLGELLSLLANALSWLSFLRYLNFGFDFGLSQPFTLDMGIITLTLGFTVKFTVCGVLGLVAATFVYKKM